DRTRTRVSTFFGDGVVAHVSFADPVCPQLADVIQHAAQDANIPIKRGGTYVCMEGPQFSTRAESNVYRGWGMDLIGMTNLQEAQLAREAEICDAPLATRARRRPSSSSARSSAATSRSLRERWGGR